MAEVARLDSVSINIFIRRGLMTRGFTIFAGKVGYGNVFYKGLSHGSMMPIRASERNPEFRNINKDSTQIAFSKGLENFRATSSLNLKFTFLG